jgi:hypothetical protein
VVRSVLAAAPRAGGTLRSNKPVGYREVFGNEFTFTVLSTGRGDVISRVYIYPGRVRADCSALDSVLYDAVLAWAERDWPFDSI